MTIVSIACFAGYIVVFGMAFGISPTQLTHAFSSQPVEKATGEGAEADSNAVHDSTMVEGHHAAADSVVGHQAEHSSESSDSLKQQLADINKEKLELEKLKAEVTALLKAKAKADSVQIGNLAKMYDGVEPAQLAQVMANMDDSLVIAILPRLKAQKAGKILERMPADRAARISSKLLGYN
jgi:flagellar motility protein MotE (MotC chaperone)